MSDEELVSECLWKTLGVRSTVAGSRYQSYDVEVTLGIDGVEPGWYEIKRLYKTKGGSFDRRFKVGQRGERMYGRRDAEIKSFAMGLEDFLDKCTWGVQAVEDTHDFIDQALLRKHGKKFNERLTRLARAGLQIPDLMFRATAVLTGGVRTSDILAGFSNLKGIFVIAGDIYTLVKPIEYSEFIGFDSASAEGPKLTYQGVVPLEQVARKKLKG